MFDHNIHQLFIIDEGAILLVLKRRQQSKGTNDLTFQRAKGRGGSVQFGEKLKEGPARFGTHSKLGAVKFSESLLHFQIGLIEFDHFLFKFRGIGLHKHPALLLADSGQALQILDHHLFWWEGRKLGPDWHLWECSENELDDFIAISVGHAANQSGSSKGLPILHFFFCSSVQVLTRSYGNLHLSTAETQRA